MKGHHLKIPVNWRNCTHDNNRLLNQSLHIYYRNYTLVCHRILLINKHIIRNSSITNKNVLHLLKCIVKYCFESNTKSYALSAVVITSTIWNTLLNICFTLLMNSAFIFKISFTNRKQFSKMNGISVCFYSNTD